MLIVVVMFTSLLSTVIGLAVIARFVAGMFSAEPLALYAVCVRPLSHKQPSKPEEPMSIHKATPAVASDRSYFCTVCGCYVHNVTGSQGTTWVHTATGTVVAGPDGK